MVEPTFDPNTIEAEADEFLSSMPASSRIARVAQRDPVLKNKTK